MALFEEIAASIRLQIVNGALQPGDRLPSVREMSERWGCAPGTVQRAYKELTRQGLIAAQVGQGSRVAARAEAHTPLRRAALTNQIEAFLLGVFAAGYTPGEVENAVHTVLERWQAQTGSPAHAPLETIRFVGSHDPGILLLAQRFEELAPGFALKVTFAGSVSGLIALARFGADIAGCHLWDAETGTYNKPFIHRFLPGRQVALLTLAHRRVGLIVPPGNPASVNSLRDLANSHLRFINRPQTAGTRIWLDTQLAQQGIKPAQIRGYDDEAATHLEVAGTVASGRADAGLGVEAAALAYGLDFVLLASERYDLVIPAEVWDLPALRTLRGWLLSHDAKTSIDDLGGYDTAHTGHVEWVG